MGTDLARFSCGIKCIAQPINAAAVARSASPIFFVIKKRWST